MPLEADAELLRPTKGALNIAPCGAPMPSQDG